MLDAGARGRSSGQAVGNAGRASWSLLDRLSLVRDVLVLQGRYPVNGTDEALKRPSLVSGDYFPCCHMFPFLSFMLYEGRGMCERQIFKVRVTFSYHVPIPNSIHHKHNVSTLFLFFLCCGGVDKEQYIC